MPKNILNYILKKISNKLQKIYIPRKKSQSNCKRRFSKEIPKESLKQFPNQFPNMYFAKELQRSIPKKIPTKFTNIWNFSRNSRENDHWNYRSAKGSSREIVVSLSSNFQRNCRKSS